MAWRNGSEGGSGRTDDNRGPKPTHSRQPISPGDADWNGLAPQPGPRQGEDVRLYRRARVTAS